MCKEGWCVRLGQEEVVWEGGGGAGSRGGCLKKRGIGTPLQTITKEKLKKQIENVTEPAKKIFDIVLYCST